LTRNLRLRGRRLELSVGERCDDSFGDRAIDGILRDEAIAWGV
jgi:hypothetical protein